MEMSQVVKRQFCQRECDSLLECVPVLSLSQVSYCTAGV